MGCPCAIAATVSRRDHQFHCPLYSYRYADPYSCLYSCVPAALSQHLPLSHGTSGIDVYLGKWRIRLILFNTVIYLGISKAEREFPVPAPRTYHIGNPICPELGQAGVKTPGVGAGGDRQHGRSGTLGLCNKVHISVLP